MLKKRALEQRKALMLHSTDNNINTGKVIQSSLLESTKTVMCLSSLYIHFLSFKKILPAVNTCSS